MKYLSLSLLGICVAISSFSQHICYSDETHEVHLEHSTEHRAQFFGMNESILNKILANRSGDDVSDSFTIPTVVHVIHNNGEENISDTQIEQAISWLNEAFLNSGDAFNPDGIETNVQFCLAGTDPEGNLTNGIIHSQSTLTNMLVPSNDQDLKDVSRWNTSEYFNIWVVNSITREDNSPGVLGYSTFPDAHGEDNDGVVIEASYFGSSAVSNRAIIHEVGHYLGLYHTFQSGCPNDDCLTSGDMVCDTPPDQSLTNWFCFDGTNSCSTDEDDSSQNNPFRAIELGGLGDRQDMQNNYMDYTGLHCFQLFTAGQIERMEATLGSVRSSLFDSDKCATPCATEFTADVSASSSAIDVGESINFTNSTEGITTSEWYINDVLSSSSENFIFTPTEQGEYLVEAILNNDDAGCQQVLEFNISVFCPLELSVTADATNISVDGTVNFTANVEGSGITEWYLDGQELIDEGNTSEYTFEEAGVFSIEAITTNEFNCSVSSSINISVGSCTTGNENNIWHWHNAAGTGYGFDFNSNPVELLATDPMVGTGHCKATICDQAGNLLFLSNGTEVYDRNYEVVENGANLLGNPSSHFGTSFLKAPGSDSEYYVFTTSSTEEDFSDGLRYSIIDSEANDGLGLVTDIKNELVEITGVEHHNIIKHCNLIDKWLVFYDVEESKFKAYLISENGIESEPVESDIALVGLDNPTTTTPIKVSPPGDKVMFDKFLFDFNQSTGEFELLHEFDVDISLAYEFSPNGKVLYLLNGEIEIKIWQYDLTMPFEFLNPEPFEIPLDIFDLGLGMRKGPDNIIYYEKAFSGGINTINSPNFLGQAMDYNEDTFFSNAVINSFGSFYHGYISGKELFIDGDETICAGTDHTFSVYGSDCIESEIDWEFSGVGNFNVMPNETVEASFTEPGQAVLIAKTQTGCGELVDSLYINVIEGPDFDLGPPIGYCPENPIIELNMPSEFEFYLWNTGSNDQTLTLESPEPQTIEASGYYQGCYISDNIEIIGELSSEIDLGSDTSLCEGEIIVLDAGPGYQDYLWQDGSTNQTFTAFLGGNYSVSVSSPCSASDNIFIDECDSSVGISEPELASFHVFPNPVADVLMLNFNLIPEEVNIELKDVQGKIVFSRNEYLTSKNFKLDVSALAEGEYVLSIRSSKFKLTDRIIKLKNS